MQHGDGPATTVPDHVVWLVYGRFGLSAEHTTVLAYARPYVPPLVTPRRDAPYSILDIRTGRTVERWSEPAAAKARLGELVPHRRGR